MNTSVYSINKAINKPIEFKGLKAQYIWFLGGGLVALLIVFAVLYICGVNAFVCLCIIVSLTICLFVQIYGLSNKYGEFGLMKAMPYRRIPKVIKIKSKKTFIDLGTVKKKSDEK